VGVAKGGIGDEKQFLVENPAGEFFRTELMELIPRSGRWGRSRIED
jgi:hypothetical protein